MSHDLSRAVVLALAGSFKCLFELYFISNQTIQLIDLSQFKRTVKQCLSISAFQLETFKLYPSNFDHDELLSNGYFAYFD